MYLFPVIINLVVFAPSTEKSLYIWKSSTCVLLFPLSVIAYSSEIQAEWCLSLSCLCAVLLWAFPPVFSLSVCRSLCQTSLIPQTLITAALWGDTPPLFYSAPADRGLHAGVTAWFCSPNPAATVANVVLQHFRVHLLHISTYSVPSTIGHLVYFI